MVNKNVLIIVPRDCKELILLVLEHSIHKLLRLVAQVIQNQLHRQCLVICLHLHEVHTRIRAHNNLVSLYRIL